ncbi:MAG: hypothetical protein HZC41_13420 [Chloroflexi bacterium]|nr:hypothetical protein [Chloroflexota bacterium]
MSFNNNPPGFKLPVNIPDAPERVTWPELVATAVPLLRTSFDAFRRKPGAYETALGQATWWHFWVLVGAASLISGVATAFTLLIIEVQLAAIFAGYQADFLRPILGLILGIPVSFFAFYGGSYASYWWAINQAGGRARLIEHSYALAVIWAAENIIAALVTLALSMIGLAGIALLISVGVVIYALVVMTGHLSRLYQFPNRSQTWITAGVMVVTSWMISVLLQSFLL